ncbi:GNAT family N-acetyltransferase [Streptomyces sp. HUAS TT20]|uniref:GNAT family N-acetyltransferase n=1 Tax=Streptomyces sp. HUAS TT20 TaxID=3447509 RepID=UPI0021D99D31|nr:GNAT family N-acetyltransferase [Streptomyces sp. HUAS 15-9]UXY28321.1 GNAT family N-acetyltransferase [Streptomyces sp. HUAS 15-9]
MRAWGGEQVQEAVAGCTATLRTVADRDWTGVNAGRLEWSCHRTALHIASDLIAYAGQLAGRAQDAYVPFDITLDEGTDNAGLLHVIETTGALLAATVRVTPPDVRAWHPYPFRSADREGFAAMGIAEVLLHTHDMAEGIGIPYEPSEDLAESVLTWLFPHVQPGPAAWPTLLWATGRGELPGRAPVTEWRWCNNLVVPAERLTLTGVRPAAARDLRLGGDGGFDWIEGGPYEGTREAAGMAVKAYETGVHRPEFGLFVLVRREDGRAIGGMGFHGAPDEDGRAEIGYDLVEGARGQGYATEALRALSRWALARDDVRTLFATVDLANTASQGVVTRAGFKQVSEGEEEELAYELRRA